MATYSVDLRKRVITAVDNGLHINVAVTTFMVSRRVVYKWLQLRRETGDLQAKSGYQKGHSHKIKDWDAFTAFANKNRQCTGPQMIVKWHELTGTNMSESAMYDSLKKIGFTSKKNFSLHRSK